MAHRHADEGPPSRIPRLNTRQDRRAAVNRAAAYELALASDRPTNPANRSATHQSHAQEIAAYEAAKLASDFDPENRDENVDYYIAKLDDLVKKFGGVTAPEAKQATLL